MKRNKYSNYTDQELLIIAQSFCQYYPEVIEITKETYNKNKRKCKGDIKKEFYFYNRYNKVPHYKKGVGLLTLISKNEKEKDLVDFYTYTKNTGKMKKIYLVGMELAEELNKRKLFNKSI